jgi:hypothetical protein
MGDVIYLDVEDDEDVAPGVKTNVELRGWVVTPSVGYNLVETKKVRFDILGGARYLWLRADLDLTGFPSLSAKGHVWDGIGGVRGRLTLGERWFIPFYGDVGAGDSDLTWQVFGGVGYKFKKFDLVLAYRYLEWDFDDDSAIDDLDFSGPFLGIKFRF